MDELAHHALEWGRYGRLPSLLRQSSNRYFTSGLTDGLISITANLERVLSLCPPTRKFGDMRACNCRKVRWWPGNMRASAKSPKSPSWLSGACLSRRRCRLLRELLLGCSWKFLGERCAHEPWFAIASRGRAWASSSNPWVTMRARD